MSNEKALRLMAISLVAIGIVLCVLTIRISRCESLQGQSTTQPTTQPIRVFLVPQHETPPVGIPVEELAPTSTLPQEWD